MHHNRSSLQLVLLMSMRSSINRLFMTGEFNKVRVHLKAGCLDSITKALASEGDITVVGSFSSNSHIYLKL